MSLFGPSSSAGAAVVPKGSGGEPSRLTKRRSTLVVSEDAPKQAVTSPVHLPAANVPKPARKTAALSKEARLTDRVRSPSPSRDTLLAHATRNSMKIKQAKSCEHLITVMPPSPTVTECRRRSQSSESALVTFEEENLQGEERFESLARLHTGSRRRLSSTVSASSIVTPQPQQGVVASTHSPSRLPSAMATEASVKRRRSTHVGSTAHFLVPDPTPAEVATRPISWHEDETVALEPELFDSDDDMDVQTFQVFGLESPPRPHSQLQQQNSHKRSFKRSFKQSKSGGASSSAAVSSHTSANNSIASFTPDPSSSASNATASCTATPPAGTSPHLLKVMSQPMLKVSTKVLREQVEQDLKAERLQQQKQQNRLSNSSNGSGGGRRRSLTLPSQHSLLTPPLSTNDSDAHRTSSSAATSFTASALPTNQNGASPSRKEKGFIMSLLSRGRRESAVHASSFATSGASPLTSTVSAFVVSDSSLQRRGTPPAQRRRESRARADSAPQLIVKGGKVTIEDFRMPIPRVAAVHATYLSRLDTAQPTSIASVPHKVKIIPSPRTKRRAERYVEIQEQQQEFSTENMTSSDVLRHGLKTPPSAPRMQRRRRSNTIDAAVLILTRSLTSMSVPDPSSDISSPTPQRRAKLTPRSPLVPQSARGSTQIVHDRLSTRTSMPSDMVSTSCSVSAPFLSQAPSHTNTSCNTLSLVPSSTSTLSSSGEPSPGSSDHTLSSHKHSSSSITSPSCPNFPMVGVSSASILPTGNGLRQVSESPIDDDDDGNNNELDMVPSLPNGLSHRMSLAARSMDTSTSASPNSRAVRRVSLTLPVTPVSEDPPGKYVVLRKRASIACTRRARADSDPEMLRYGSLTSMSTFAEDEYASTPHSVASNAVPSPGLSTLLSLTASLEQGAVDVSYENDDDDNGDDKGTGSSQSVSRHGSKNSKRGTSRVLRRTSSYNPSKKHSVSSMASVSSPSVPQVDPESLRSLSTSQVSAPGETAQFFEPASPKVIAFSNAGMPSGASSATNSSVSSPSNNGTATDTVTGIVSALPLRRFAGRSLADRKTRGASCPLHEAVGRAVIAEVSPLRALQRASPGVADSVSPRAGSASSCESDSRSPMQSIVSRSPSPRLRSTRMRSDSVTTMELPVVTAAKATVRLVRGSSSTQLPSLKSPSSSSASTVSSSLAPRSPVSPTLSSRPVHPLRTVFHPDQEQPHLQLPVSPKKRVLTETTV